MKPEFNYDLKMRLCLFLCFSLCANISLAHRRKLLSKLNPGCDKPNCKDALLVHVRADGDNDTLHHVWDFTDKPSLLLVRSVHSSELNITWEKYLSTNDTSVSFNPDPVYVFGVTLDKVFEFNDEFNTGIFDVNNFNRSYVRVYDARDFHWDFVQAVLNDTETALLSIVGKHHFHETNKTGLIRITMGAYGGVEHGSTLPRLMHSSNSSQMDITLENMPSSFEKSRYGVNLITVSSDKPNSTMVLDVRKTVDDERTPGVFNIVEVLSPEARSDNGDDEMVNGGYLQWRPIVFTSQSRDVTNSSDSVHYNVTYGDMKRLKKTLFHKLFGQKLSEKLISSTNITFGAAGDKYYSKSNFVSWTFVTGIGHPMEEGFSTLIYMILAIGLGLPILLVVIGVICILTRRILKNKDDLFLSQ